MKRLKKILPYLGIVLGLAILAYYPVTEALDANQRAKVASGIDTSASEADDADVEYLLEQAEAYNLYLAGLTADIPEDEVLPYEEQLSLTGSNASFGYVIIPTISLTIPVYHGTSDAVLSAGAGHLETSSLPVGGESTHSVITAHSGLSGSRMFDDIDQLEIGDVFGVKVLGQLCCYEVTSIETVLPEEVDSLGIQMGEDLCTLVTCTPYGVNTHRLLVHGTRCAVPDGFDSDPTSAVESVASSTRMLPFLIAVAVLLVLLVALAVWQWRRKRSGGSGGGSAGGAGGSGADGSGSVQLPDAGAGGPP